MHSESSSFRINQSIIQQNFWIQDTARHSSNFTSFEHDDTSLYKWPTWRNVGEGNEESVWRGAKVRCSHSCVHPCTRCEVKPFPQDQKRHFRDYVPSLGDVNWSENHKTFPRPSYYFFLLRITNRKESGRRRGTYTDRKNREREWFLSPFRCLYCARSVAIDRQT